MVKTKKQSKLKEPVYATKAQLDSGLHNLEKRMDKKFDDFRQIMLECFDFVYKKIDAHIERLDRHIAQNAVEHSKFDTRIIRLEESQG